MLTMLNNQLFFRQHQQIIKKNAYYIFLKISPLNYRDSICAIIQNWHTFIPWAYFHNLHRQGGCLACCGCTFESRWGCTDLCCAQRAQGVLPMRVGGATSQLDLASLTPLSVAICVLLQLGVPHWAASVYYCK